MESVFTEEDTLLQSFDPFDNPGPTKVGNRYVGKCYASSGEPVYFTTEQLISENLPHWKQYVEASKVMAGYDSALLVYLAERTVKIEPSYGSIRYQFSEKYNDELAKSTGFSESEFHAFINYLGQRGFSATEKQKLYALSGNGEGSHQIFLREDYYITYASKTPEFSIQNIELLPEDRIMTLKEFRQKYSNLLMCVGSFPSAFKSLQNRGIFKNLGCVIDGGYAYVAMPMTGFIAAFAKKFLGIDVITVKPVSSMQHFILKSIKREDITFDSQDPERAYQLAKELSDNFRSSCYVSRDLNIIKANALAEIYYQNCVPPAKKDESFFSSFFSQPDKQSSFSPAISNDSCCCTIL